MSLRSGGIESSARNQTSFGWSRGPTERPAGAKVCADCQARVQASETVARPPGDRPADGGARGESEGGLVRDVAAQLHAGAQVEHERARGEPAIRPEGEAGQLLFGREGVERGPARVG